MRILHVTDAFAPNIGGIERQVQTLALRQLEQGHDVTVLTAVDQRAPIDGQLTVVRAAKRYWLSVAFPWLNRRSVQRTLEEGKFDVLHAHFTVVSPLAVYVSRLAGRREIPVVVTVHSLWSSSVITNQLCMLPFGWGRLRASWSAVSSVAAGYVERTLRGAGEIRIVPNLVQTQWWQRPTQALDSPTDRPLHVILVGRLKRRKHFPEFLDALAAARSRVAPETTARVTIVGEGPRRAGLEKQIAALGLGDWVELVGQRDPEAIRELLHDGDVFVASSRQESFGVAALEARSAGLPVVGYQGSGLADFVDHGVDGLLLASPAELSDTLVDLLGDRTLVDQLQTTARSTPPAISADDGMRAVEDLYLSAGVGEPVPEPTAGAAPRTEPAARLSNPPVDGGGAGSGLRVRSVARPAAARPARRWHWWRELILVGLFYEVYNFIQHLITGSTARAIHHGYDILRVERALHLDPEMALNHAVSGIAALAVPACYVYTTLHFLVTPAVLIWAHYANPGTYSRNRAALAIMTIVALAGFLWFPTAPPRLLLDGNYIDTVTQYRNWGWWTSNSLPSGARDLENTFAAMPSLHVAWAVWSGGTIFGIVRNKIVRTLAVAYPVIVALVVMATANHYLADVLAGALLWPLALGIVHVASVVIRPTLSRLGSAASSAIGSVIKV